jgi:hypothetical protein
MYKYVIVFNTTGNGQEPYPQALLTGFTNYSFAFVVGGPTGLAALPQLLQYYLQPGTSSGIETFQVSIPTNLINFIPNLVSNGSGGEFDITFARSLLYGINPGGTPAATGAPSASPSPTPTVTATATATAGGTASPTATATATVNPLVQATTAAQVNWNINFIVANASTGTPVDSMGLGGADDTSFTYTVNTTTAVDNVYTKPVNIQVSDPAAQLSGYEVINSP